MNLFGMMQVSGSALLAERERAELTASNLANAETTRTIEGGPYRRQNVIFASRHPAPTGFATTLASFTDIHTQGVEVAGIFQDPTAPARRYDPGHPDADASGLRQFSQRQSCGRKCKPGGGGALLPAQHFGDPNNQGDDSIGDRDCPVVRGVTEDSNGKHNSRAARTEFGDIFPRSIRSNRTIRFFRNAARRDEPGRAAAWRRAG